jgi:hypothetical protein
LFRARAEADDAPVLAHAHICRAIRSRTLIEFDYEGCHRIVAPYCHGVTGKNVEIVRAIQVGGVSRSAGFGFGKLWHVAKMINLSNTREPFLPTDPDYRRDDSVMAQIHCCV